MKTKELTPIADDVKDIDAIERAIIELLRKEIFLPLIKELGVNKLILKNSIEDLIDAIASGKIYYANGYFKGSFNATITKELRKIGVWDKKKEGFKVPKASLSVDMQTAIETSKTQFLRMAEKINKKLDAIDSKEIAQKLRVEKVFDTAAWKLNKNFEKSIENITVAPKLTDYQRKRIAEEYTNNLHLYIQDWTDKEITKLRKAVQVNVMQGIRRDKLAELIQESYGVGINKAKFLARQETNLMTTKLKQTRYQQAGVNSYRWQTVVGSPAHPVRPEHKKLDGTVHTWDNPPIATKDGQKKNPGQDYNCRCIAVPIVKF